MFGILSSCSLSLSASDMASSPENENKNENENQSTPHDQPEASNEEAVSSANFWDTIPDPQHTYEVTASRKPKRSKKSDKKD